MASAQVRTCRTTTTRTSKQVQQVRTVGVMIPMGTPRSRGRYTDDGDDRMFRQVTDEKQGRGSELGFGREPLNFISMAMNMARPHTGDLEAMPSRSPGSLFPGESQASGKLADRPRGPGTLVLAPRDFSSRPTQIQYPGQFDEHEGRYRIRCPIVFNCNGAVA